MEVVLTSVECVAISTKIISQFLLFHLLNCISLISIFIIFTILVHHHFNIILSVLFVTLNSCRNCTGKKVGLNWAVITIRTQHILQRKLNNSLDTPGIGKVMSWLLFSHSETKYLTHKIKEGKV